MIGLRTIIYADSQSDDRLHTVEIQPGTNFLHIYPIAVPRKGDHIGFNGERWLVVLVHYQITAGIIVVYVQKRITDIKVMLSRQGLN